MDDQMGGGVLTFISCWTTNIRSLFGGNGQYPFLPNPDVRIVEKKKVVQSKFYRLLNLIFELLNKHLKSLELFRLLISKVTSQCLTPVSLQAYLIYSSSVAAGAQSGIEECKYQFAWDRWNCPERALQLSSHGGLRSANRETAFVHAISSAGVMYTLTRNCSLGDFDNCGCDDSRNGQLGGQGWLWGGCSDNVGFGEAISKQFVDALETGQDARAAMNLHNNEAGRKAVKGTMKRTCKCHGVSGSCTTQTCWLQLPEFREVGAHLKEKYHAALKVDLLQGAGNSAAGRGAIADTFRSISTRELVHLEDSPDYCLENKTLGLLGTEGRECLRRGRALGRWERRSCRRLCGDCGLAVEERRAETVSSCNCKFHWCCAVRCEQCRRRVTKYFCSRADRPRGGAAHKPGRKP
ncbi:hypothetical protein EI555_012952 [Monodon monoceros]|uniref:Protein Wnt n=1 Tax=Monodon monoceros TaxID=40151 RepID=A0A4U1FDS7_MONMO|nr:hypothetical protein EI555_012952 [Monodon monoceros]